MRRLSVFMALCLSPLLQAQTVKLPDEIKVKQGRLGAVVIQWDGDAAEVITSPNLDAFREYDPNPAVFRLRVLMYEGTEGKITIVVAKTVDGKSVQGRADCKVSWDTTPGPTPPPTPPPGPPDPPPTPPQPDPVSADDPDYPGPTVDATLVKNIKTAAGTWAKTELYKLAKAHVSAANSLKASVNPKVSTVTTLMQNAIGAQQDVPDALATLLGGELNKVLPRDPSQTLTASQIKMLRKKMLAFAQALTSASR